ncbi:MULTISPECIES: exopolysaccharide biosynthesis polyprenyl glycosylphosphotransferase [unclassified Amedibacterium]|uniref:exopolysaccharide biosynthesis polyprenyl glycosylphosphotransferase n=2 Tax=Amedibacterium TaxID=2749267 RepID=UPI000E3F7E82|nr:MULTISPECIES: exopolysaccharide biosynthesis polyprenyl glycosylphosphotransferase [unclassified Absiella]RGB65545.1 exopolysaccharide biosynthesis polyprenyl glycosylphosphotransferase [Absiella sp. AM09-45]RGB74531.1 exopolysaccharide biosynthesis polyprenyl glycosylphosphotransferase [Absiella sp. AM09-50]RGC53188.1 exopolysaccharide biosynthesis polyprenyl glycosylphosphotransferase [Absiella sp. AM29-15]
MRTKTNIGIVNFLSEVLFVLLIMLLVRNSMDYTLRFVILYFMIQAMFGHYRVSTLLIWEEVQLLIKSHLCFYMASLLLIPIGKRVLYLLLFNLLITFLMFIFDVFISRTIRILLRNYAKERVLIIGTGKEAQQLGHVVKTNRFSLMEVVGYVDVNDKELFPRIHQSIEVEGDIYPVKNLVKVIEQQDIDTAIIAIPNASRKQMDHFMSILYNKVEKIKYLPRTSGMVTFDTKVQDFDGMLVISTAKGKTTKGALIMKRLIDIAGGLAGMIILLPLYFYVRKKNHANGDYDPIFFTQERIGKNGKPFKIYKFRTMVPNAETVLEKLMEENPAIREEYETNKKLRNDPRITAAGKVLREKSLDEFPQFINVIKGEMSMVGPRPYLPREIKDMGIYYNSVIGCTPGVTGMWQSHGRSDVSFDDRLKMDDYYYRNWTIWLDLTILIKTVKMVFKGEGAL